MTRDGSLNRKAKMLHTTIFIYTLTCFLFISYGTNGNDNNRLKNISAFTAPKSKSTWNRLLKQGPIPAETTEAPRDKICVCSKIYDPVCASDNKSYYNSCQMECSKGSDNITIVHQGNCIPF